MSEYRVVLSDLADLYKAFYREERTLDNQRHKLPHPAPDCGDAKTTKTASEALDAVRTLYDLLMKEVDAQGDKIKSAHDAYDRDNADVLNLFNRLEG